MSGPAHVGHIAEVVLRGDLVGQNRPGATRIHVAAPDAIQIERGAERCMRSIVERIVRDVARDADVGGCHLHVSPGCRGLEILDLRFGQRSHVFEKAVDERRVAVVRHE